MRMNDQQETSIVFRNPIARNIDDTAMQRLFLAKNAIECSRKVKLAPLLPECARISASIWPFDSHVKAARRLELPGPLASGSTCFSFFARSFR